MSSPPPDARYLDAAEAARRLGISRSSLYSYVSRGQIRSEPLPGGARRSRRYVAEDVERLLERKRLRREPDRAGERFLDWGAPVVESSISLIDRGRLYYRGRDVLELAESASFEEVAALLWTGDPAAAERLFAGNRSGGESPARSEVPAPRGSIEPVGEAVGETLGETLGGLERCQVALALAGARDPAAWDLRPPAMAATGARVLSLVCERVAAATRPAGQSPSAPSTLSEPSDPSAEGPRSIAARLARAWRARSPDADRGRDVERVLSATLILCADHELNVSAFTARCVASAEATLYDAVAAGLAALKGRRHGGVTERITALLREIGEPAAPGAGSGAGAGAGPPALSWRRACAGARRSPASATRSTRPGTRGAPPSSAGPGRSPAAGGRWS